MIYLSEVCNIVTGCRAFNTCYMRWGYINIPTMILSLIRSVFGRRISPASDRLSARFLRRGVPPPRLNRPASEDPPAQRRGDRASLDVDTYQEISDNPCPVSECCGPWSLDRVFAFAWFFPVRPLRPPTHGEGHLRGRHRHCGGLRGWLYL